MIPEKLTGFNLYNSGDKLLGNTAEVEAPDMDAITTTLSGAGIAGEIESPNIGQFGSMTMTISFRTVSKESTKLNEPGRHDIVLRGNQQVHDRTTGTKRNRKLKISAGGEAKSYKTGTFNTTGGVTDTQVVLEVEHFKIEEGGEELLELDKRNYIYAVNGKDYLEEPRNNM